MKVCAESFRPPQDELREVQLLAQGIREAVEDPHDWLHNFVKTHATRFAFDIHHTEQFSSDCGNVIIDVGAAPFLTANALAGRGHEVTALDLAPERFAGLSEILNVKVLKCDIEREPFPLLNNQADIVLLFEVFEHLRINPIFTFSEIMRVLKPNGVLLLSTPNLKSLKGLYNFLFRDLAYSCAGNIYEEYSKLEKFGHMGHVREYTSREIIDFSRHFSMRCEGIIYRGTFHRSLVDALCFTMPRLRPFQTLVLRKQNE